MSELISICGTSSAARWGDIVFVHGLNGDARATWHPEGQAEESWPKWLCEDIPEIKVWSVGYEASSFGWKGSTMPLADRAVNALVLLETYGIGKEKPVVFITHSLGGLLVKEMLRKATNNSVSEGRQLAEHTKGVVFLSTPHSGSDLANFVDFLKVLLPSDSVRELKPNEPRLRELNTWYRNNVSNLGIKTQVYCERKPTKAGQRWFLGRFEAMVVDANSSDPGIAGVTAVPLDEDHLSISCPKRDSLLYRRISEFIRENLKGSSKESGDTATSATVEKNSGARPQNEQSILKDANIGGNVTIGNISQTMHVYPSTAPSRENPKPMNPWESADGGINSGRTRLTRKELIITLTGLMEQQLKQLASILNMPNALKPGSAGSGEWALKLIEWAESPTGCGIDKLTLEVEALLPSKVKISMNSSQQVRLSAAQNHVNALLEDLEAAHKQLNFTQDEVQRGRLNRQIESLDKDLEKAEEGLQKLKMKLGID
jgi:pimeloyl-ACP methyl ester carboxylesterase